MGLDDGKPDLKPAISKVEPAKPFHESWWFRFVGLPVVGAILGALCPILPVPAQVVCVAVSGVVRQIPASAFTTDESKK